MATMLCGSVSVWISWLTCVTTRGQHLLQFQPVVIVTNDVWVWQLGEQFHFSECLHVKVINIQMSTGIIIMPTLTDLTNTFKYIIDHLGTISWVRWPNQQCHSTEGRWLRANPTRLSSMTGKVNIHSTMRTKDTKALGRQRAKPSKIKAQHSRPTCKNCSYLCAPL